MKVAPLLTAAGGLKLVTTAQDIGERTNKLQKVIKAIFKVYKRQAYNSKYENRDYQINKCQSCTIRDLEFSKVSFVNKIGGCLRGISWPC